MRKPENARVINQNRKLGDVQEKRRQNEEEMPAAERILNSSQAPPADSKQAGHCAAAEGLPLRRWKPDTPVSGRI